MNNHSRNYASKRELDTAQNAGMSPYDAAMKRLIDRLLIVGSVKALAREVGDEPAARALYELTESAPQELQPSWPLVLAWARIQESYEIAARMGDSAEMRRSGEALAKIVRDSY